MERYFELLEYATSKDVDFTKTRVFAFDPLKSLTDNLAMKMKEYGFDIDDGPSTSDCMPIVPDSTFDSRIRYSHLVMNLLEDISKHIVASTSAAENPHIVLSTNNLTKISSAVQFFIATAVLPYLDEGVATPMELRSNLIKFWKSLRDNRELRCKQLLAACETLYNLLQSSESVKALIVGKYVRDIIAVNEQLINLGEVSLAIRYERFIANDIFRPTLIYNFITILNGYSFEKRQIHAPIWLKRSIGDRLSKMLIEPNGLYHLATAVVEDDIQRFEDFTFVSALTRVILTRPKGMKNYYSNILNQFMDVMEHHPSAEHLSVWFALTIEMTIKIQPQLVVVKIFDSLLHPWEALMDRSVGKINGVNLWTEKLGISLRILNFCLKRIPRGMQFLDKNRLEKLFLLCLILYYGGQHSLEGMDNSTMKEKYRTFPISISEILLYILENHSNDETEQAHFIINQVINAEEAIGSLSVQYTYRNCITEVVDNDIVNLNRFSKSYFDFVLVKRVTQQDYQSIEINCRLNAILEILKRSKSLSFERCVYNMLTICVKGWRISDDDCDEGFEIKTSRFIELDSTYSQENKAHKRMCMQYIMGHLYTLLPDINVDSEENISVIIRFAQVVLDSTYQKISKSVIANIDVDVSCGTLDDLNQTELASVQMALAIIGGSLFSYDSSNLRIALVSLVATIKQFRDLLFQVKEKREGEYVTLYDSASKLLDCLSCIGIDVKGDEHDHLCLNTCGASSETPCHGIKAQEHLSQILTDIENGTEAVRGHGLIMLARGVRKRNKSLLTDLESHSGVLDIVMRSIADSDSYVYLAAINCLAEFAYWKREFLDDTVEFFVDPYSRLSRVFESDIGDAENKSEFMMIQRVKVGEALGKVCKALGAMAPWYYDRLIDPLIFLISKVDDELLRASSFCSISDLVQACQRRKLHKNISELLMLIERTLDSAKEAILRRAAISLMRGIILSFDSSVFMGLKDHLRDINRKLRWIVNVDKDHVVRLLAELCLIDIKEQIKDGILDIQSNYCRRIVF